MNRNIMLVPLLVALCFLTACATTPSSIRELSNKTAANIGVLSAQVSIMSSESKKLAEQRSANIAQLHLANVKLRSEYNYDIALTQKAGDQANLALIETVTKWTAQVDAIFAESDDAEAIRNAEFLENYQTIATNSKELAAIAQSLATLAKEENFEDRAQFLAGFAKQLKGDFDTQIKQGSESAKHAEELLDSISN